MPQFSWKLVFAALLLLAVVGGQSNIEAQNAGKPPTAGADEESPLLIEPKTPEEFFQAAVLMHRLARPNFARQYLQMLMDTKPTDATLLKLRDKFGAAPFLRLSNAKELRPVSSDLLKLVNVAFRKRGADPKYISSVLDALNGTAVERRVAVITLQNTGAIVVPRILERIAAAGNAPASTLLRETLRELGEPAVAPLLAAINSPNDTVRLAAIGSLAAIRPKNAAPYLWYPAFNEKELKGIKLAARIALSRIYGTSVFSVQKTAPASITTELKRNALLHFRGEYSWKPGVDKKVELWSWNTAAKTVQLSRVTPEAASLYIGTRFAREALALSPENRDSQALFVAMSLAASADPKWENPLPTGPGTPHDMALAAGSDVLLDALATSTKFENATAAVASLIVLRQVASKSDIGRGSPVMAALNDPSSRVRFAAAGTILHVDPNRKFAGSSRVIDILARALTDDGSAKGLVVNASVEKGVTLAGQLASLGYDGLVAQTGRDGFRKAAERADVDLILLQLNTIRWPLSQTIANLRADIRTARIPIVIYGPAGRSDRVATHVQRYQRVAYIAESSTGDGLANRLRPFLASLKTNPLTPKQRAAQRSAAVYWLAQIASGHRSRLYDLKPAEKAIVTAMYDPELTANATLALSAIATKTAQQSIGNVAINLQINARLREAAALQLAYHIQKYGLLLEAADILAVKQSLAAATDSGLATALTTVMGSLKPNRKLIGDRLRTFPLPKVPAGN